MSLADDLKAMIAKVQPQMPMDMRSKPMRELLERALKYVEAMNSTQYVSEDGGKSWAVVPHDWIKVSDRLPEGGLVLIHFADASTYIGEWVADGQFWNVDAQTDHRGEVTHWCHFHNCRRANEADV